MHLASPHTALCLLRQIRSDSPKGRFAQLTRLQQVAKFTDRRLIGHRFPTEIDPDKLPHGAFSSVDGAHFLNDRPLSDIRGFPLINRLPTLMPISSRKASLFEFDPISQ